MYICTYIHTCCINTYVELLFKKRHRTPITHSCILKYHLFNRSSIEIFIDCFFTIRSAKTFRKYSAKPLKLSRNWFHCAGVLRPNDLVDATLVSPTSDDSSASGQAPPHEVTKYHTRYIYACVYSSKVSITCETHSNELLVVYLIPLPQLFRVTISVLPSHPAIYARQVSAYPSFALPSRCLVKLPTSSLSPAPNLAAKSQDTCKNWTRLSGCLGWDSFCPWQEVATSNCRESN